MSNLIAIPPHADLIEEVMRHLVHDGRDYAGNVVVFPGKRPAHFLRKALGSREARSFIPPRIASIDAFIDFLYSDRLDLIHRELQPIDAVALLHGIYLRSPDRFGGASFDALDAFLPLGLRLFNELEELKMAHLPPHKVKEAISGVTFGNLRPLSTVYEQFFEEVNRRSFCTRGLKYATVADFLMEDHLDEFDRVVIAGFFGFTNAEKIIFQKLKRLDSSVFIFQHGPGLEEHVAKAGLGSIKSPAGTPSPATISFYQAPDTHGQVFGLGEMLKGRIEAHRALDERTVIVLPASESLPSVFHQTLPLLNEDEYNISLGYPVTRTPVYGFLQSLMNLIGTMHEGKFYAPEYMKFLLHPYVKNILFEGRPDATRILVHTIEEHFARGRTSVFFGLEELEQNVSLFEKAAPRVLGLGIQCTPHALRDQLLRIHNHTIRKLLGVNVIGQLARGCMEALAFIDEQSTAQYHPLFRPYVETIISVLDGVATSLLAHEHGTDVNAVLTLLQRTMNQATVPFPGTPLKGLQVLGFLETRNLKFDSVYFLDANEDVLPGIGSEHTVIPEQVRERLGLATRKQREEIAAYYFSVLVGGAGETHLFFSESPQRERSRFVEQLLWDRQAREKKDDTKEYINTISYSIQLANAIPPAVPKTERMVEALRAMSYSATALDSYLTCPLRFYYRYVLGLREKEEVVGDIDSGDVGGFVHDILRSYFSGLIGKEIAASDLGIDRLASLIDERFGQKFGKEMTGSRYVLKQQVQTQLRRFLELYQMPVIGQQRVTVLALEEKFEIKRKAFLLAGKLDRVERRGDRVFILDYKTGRPDGIRGIDFSTLDPDRRETWKDAMTSLQLPLYAILYSKGSGEPIEKAVPAYLKLGQTSINEDIEVPLFDDAADSGTVYRQMDRVFDNLLSEITDVNVPFTPTDRFDRDCTYCPFQTICGTQWATRKTSV